MVLDEDAPPKTGVAWFPPPNAIGDWFAAAGAWLVSEDDTVLLTPLGLPPNEKPEEGLL